MCFHKKSLLGLRNRETGQEQYYCNICHKIYLKERRSLMKITKGQTALIVIGVAGTIGALVLVNFIKVHPIYAILLALATTGVVVGGIMYKRNKDK
jgi:hypothetical protein